MQVSAIRRAICYIEEKLADENFIDLYLEQANIFSGIVGMFGTKALDSLSNYKKSRHVGVTQTRFPDLRRRGARQPLQPDDSLECKASLRNHAIPVPLRHTVGTSCDCIWSIPPGPSKRAGP